MAFESKELKVLRCICGKLDALVNATGGGGSGIDFPGTPPLVPGVPQTWFDTTTGTLRIYNGTSIENTDIDEGPVVDAFGVDTGIDI